MKDKILKEFDEKFNVNKHIDKGNFGEGLLNNLLKIYGQKNRLLEKERLYR